MSVFINHQRISDPLVVQAIQEAADHPQEWGLPDSVRSPNGDINLDLDQALSLLNQNIDGGTEYSEINYSDLTRRLTPNQCVFVDRFIHFAQEMHQRFGTLISRSRGVRFAHSVLTGDYPNWLPVCASNTSTLRLTPSITPPPPPSATERQREIDGNLSYMEVTAERGDIERLSLTLRTSRFSIPSERAQSIVWRALARWFQIANRTLREDSFSTASHFIRQELRTAQTLALTYRFPNYEVQATALIRGIEYRAIEQAYEYARGGNPGSIQPILEQLLELSPRFSRAPRQETIKNIVRIALYSVFRLLEDPSQHYSADAGELANHARTLAQRFGIPFDENRAALALRRISIEEDRRRNAEWESIRNSSSTP